VTAFCTGIPTSTFGGGGGTKLFCSQALNPANANMTNTIREKAAHAGERFDFIAVPHSFCTSEDFCSEKRFPPSLNSNNPLAVELETENDPAREEYLSAFQKSHRLQRRLQRDNNKDLFK
jgi:hypothetical protein